MAWLGFFGKRSTADSHNSLSEGLPLGGSERLSGGVLTHPKDSTKDRYAKQK